MKNKKEMLNKP
jgi:hypothetical protein